MKPNRREIGSNYEKQAGAFFERQGFEILAYNFRCRSGEIDIIARKGKQLVFCEVKYRRDDAKGTPLEAVGIRKQRTISKCAMYYATVHGLLHMEIRFDVIGIQGTDMKWVQNAFDYAV